MSFYVRIDTQKVNWPTTSKLVLCYSSGSCPCRARWQESV